MLNSQNASETRPMIEIREITFQQYTGKILLKQEFPMGYKYP